MSLQKGWKINLLLMIPTCIYAMLSLLSIQRGEPGSRHQACVDFWKRSQWQELIAMADNLSRLRKQDAETLYFGMLASEQLHDPQGIRMFAERLVQQNALNWRFESRVAQFLPPDSIRKTIEIHKVRITLALFAILTLLNLIALRATDRLLPWITCLSLAGCVVLLL